MKASPSRVELDEEPYRYACPHCGATGSYLVKRQKSGRADAKQYMEMETDARIGTPHGTVDMKRVADYRCDRCHRPCDALVDRAA